MSNQINDCKYLVLSALYGEGHINDLYLKYLQANGATSSNLNDAEYQFLIAQGVDAGQRNDMWAQGLRLFGTPYASLQDSLKWFWCVKNGGIPSSVTLVILPLLIDRYDVSGTSRHATLVRNSTASIVDFEGNAIDTLVHEFGFEGARRSENFAPGDLTVEPWQLVGDSTIEVAGEGWYRLKRVTTGNQSMLQFAYRPDVLMPQDAQFTGSMEIKTDSGTSSVTLRAFSHGTQYNRLCALTTQGQTFATPVAELNSPWLQVSLIVVSDGASSVDVLIRLPTLERVEHQANQSPSNFIAPNDSACSDHTIPVRYFDTTNANSVDGNGVVTKAPGVYLGIEGLDAGGTMKRMKIWSAADPDQTLPDNVSAPFPADLVNDFVLSGYWRPGTLTPCTIFESGNTRLSWDANILKFNKASFSAAVVLVPVVGVAYRVQGRISATQGVDVFADALKGTGNADVSDATPNAILQIGSTELLTEHTNGNMGDVSVVKGDLSDEEVGEIGNDVPIDFSLSGGA